MAQTLKRQMEERRALRVVRNIFHYYYQDIVFNLFIPTDDGAGTSVRMPGLKRRAGRERHHVNGYKTHQLNCQGIALILCFNTRR